MKKAIFGAVLLAVLGAGVGFYLYWTGDRRQVAALLDKLPALIRKNAGAAPHEGVLRYAMVDRVVTEPVRISAAYREMTLQRTLTRAETRSLLAMFHRQVRSAELKLGAVEIRLAGAEARFAFDGEVSAAFSGRSDTRVVHVTGTAVKQDGRWLIRSIVAEPLVQK